MLRSLLTLTLMLLSSLQLSLANEINILYPGDSFSHHKLSLALEEQLLALDPKAKPLFVYQDEDPSFIGIDKQKPTVMFGNELAKLSFGNSKHIHSFLYPEHYQQVQQAKTVANFPSQQALLNFANEIAQLNYIDHIVIPTTKEYLKSFPVLSDEKALNEKITLVAIKPNQSVIKVIEPWLYKNSLILALPNQQIWSNTQARWILKQSYEHKIPVVGFSKSFLMAGAAAALQVDKEKVLRCVAELLLTEDCQAPSQHAIYYPEAKKMANPTIAELLQLKMPEGLTQP